MFSEKRGIQLLTKEECAALFEVSTSTIKRLVKKAEVYTESSRVRRLGSRGTTKTLFIDPIALAFAGGFELPNVEPLKEEVPQIQKVNLVSEDQTSESRLQAEKANKGQEYAQCWEVQVSLNLRNRQGEQDPLVLQENHRLQLLRSVLVLSKSARAQEIAEVAADQGITKRSVYRWIAAFEREGIQGLASKKTRADQGRLRIPQATYQMIVQALVSNTPNTSLRMIHRTLLKAVPEVMQYKRGKQLATVSLSTMQTIKNRLLNDSYTRLLFHDAGKRKEHLRSYAGEVFAAHANDLWQMDMTRCDVLVCEPESGKIFRPRIHAIIDVYSGCIPGLAFALEEDQTQTDLAILRALVPKPPPYTDAWPISGIPKRMYWDNGKTYGSEHAKRVLSELGVEVVYSRPRVSHTRGKIERFFGTFHGYEKTLPGYVGENAKDRASEELKRLTKNTERWLERDLSHDPGWGNRLLTLSEYQERVMDWLLVEYHSWIIHGESRLAHFLDTVPPASQPLFSREELMTLLAHRNTRVVNPDGSIRLHNRLWTIESGELINYTGKEVLVLTNQFASGEEHLLAWKEPSGKLRLLGQATPMPERADSEEARQHRLASQAQARRAQRVARQQKQELTNPNLVVSKVLREHAQAELEIEPLPQPAHPKARLAAVNPKDPVEELDPNDAFDRHFLDPLGNTRDGPTDPKERIQWLQSRRGRRER